MPFNGDKKVPGLPGGEERVAGGPWAVGEEGGMGRGCGSGVDPPGGEGAGGFSGGASWTFLGGFAAGSKDPGEEDPGGEEIGGGDLLFPFAAGCASGDW